MVAEEQVRQIASSDSRALTEFVQLERRLVGAHSLFVSDVDSDVTKRLAGKSAFLDEADLVLFVASSRGQNFARCAAVINRRYQAAKQEAVGFIGFFAAAPDSATAVQAMLTEAEAWLKQRGVSRVIAPCNGAAVLGLGLLTDSFEEEPISPMAWNLPYYEGYLASSGYQNTYPLWFYRVDFRSEKYCALQQRALANDEVIVRPINQ